jgi:hypothetical protein
MEQNNKPYPHLNTDNNRQIDLSEVTEINTTGI